MGYAGKDLNLTGGALAAPMFQTVGNTEGEITFGAIVPVLATGAKAGAGKVNLQGLLSSGATDTTKRYMWMGTYWRNLTTLKDAKDEIIPAGQGLWAINNSGAAMLLQSSGEVSGKDINYPLNLTGGTVCANMFPIATTFGRVLPKLESGALAGAGKVNIQYLLSSGATDTTKRYMWMGTYWRNLTTLKDAKDEEIPAGQGLWVINNSGSTVKFYVAAPEL